MEQRRTMKGLYKRLWAAALIVVLILQGCALFPKEEAIKTVPVPETAGRPSYDMREVKRGDISKLVVVNVQYMPVADEDLTITDTRLPFTEILCSIGDQVEPGDLIARQDCTELEKQLDGLLTEQAQKEMEKSNLEEMRELKSEQQSELWNAASYKERENMQTEEEVYASYTAQIRKVEDRLKVLEILIEECRETIAGRELRTTIHGTVTYMMGMDDKGYLNVSSASVVATVSDIANSYFRAETEYFKKFKAGDRYPIMIKSDEYELEVVDAKTINADMKDPGAAKQYVYFRLTSLDVSLENGTRGVIRLTTDSKENVLYIPSKAVHEQSDGRYIVYCFDDNDILNIREVTIGLDTGSFVEITGGLEEGDQVTVDS